MFWKTKMLIVGLVFCLTVPAQAALLDYTVSLEVQMPSAAPQPLVTGSVDFTWDDTMAVDTMLLRAIDLTIASYSYTLAEVGVMELGDGIAFGAIQAGIGQIQHFANDFAFSLGRNPWTPSLFGYTTESSGIFWSESFTINVTSAQPVPEPSAMVLMALGVAGIAFFKRRHER